MLALLQRVKHASVTVAEQNIAAIEYGLLVFLGSKNTIAKNRQKD